MCRLNVHPSYEAADTSCVLPPQQNRPCRGQGTAPERGFPSLSEPTRPVTGTCPGPGPGPGTSSGTSARRHASGKRHAALQHRGRGGGGRGAGDVLVGCLPDRMGRLIRCHLMDMSLIVPLDKSHKIHTPLRR